VAANSKPAVVGRDRRREQRGDYGGYDHIDEVANPKGLFRFAT